MSTIICLLPNEEYVTPFPYPHLTLAQFEGDVPDGECVERLKANVDMLANVARPVRAYTDARTIFSEDPEYVVLVDLITAYPLTELRSKIERLYGPQNIGWRGSKIKLITSYGFIPHMTVGLLGDLDLNLTIDPYWATPGRQEFTLNRIALWHNEERYEVAL